MDIMSIEYRTDKEHLCGCDIQSEGRHRVGESLLVDHAEAVASRLDQNSLVAAERSLGLLPTVEHGPCGCACFAGECHTDTDTHCSRSGRSLSVENS